MKARDVVGHRIVRCNQSRTVDQDGNVIIEVDSLVLDNGTRITFHVHELGSDYAIVASAWKHKENA